MIDVGTKYNYTKEDREQLINYIINLANADYSLTEISEKSGVSKITIQKWLKNNNVNYNKAARRMYCNQCGILMKKKYQVQIGEETVNINICSLKCKNDCMANPARENLRDEQIIKSDYEVLHIKEKDLSLIHI